MLKKISQAIDAIIKIADSNKNIKSELIEVFKDGSIAKDQMYWQRFYSEAERRIRVEEKYHLLLKNEKFQDSDWETVKYLVEVHFPKVSIEESLRKHAN